MDWFMVFGLVLIGVALFVVEILFIPGTTVFGILGAGAFAAGVMLGYASFPSPTDHYIFLGSTLLAIVLVMYSLRAKSWQKFSLKDENKGKFNEDITLELHPGLEGNAVSNLRPIGKGEFNSKVYEVSTPGGFVETGDKIRIVKIDHLKIIVEKIS